MISSRGNRLTFPLGGSNNTSLCLSVPYWLVFPSLTLERLGSLSNEDGKKLIGLDWQNSNFARALRIFVHFLAVVARLHQETPFFFSRFVEDVNTREQFSFSFPELRYIPLKFNLPN